MPVMPCQTDGKPGWKYGNSGHCYPYTRGNRASSERAKNKAKAQGRAVERSKHENQ